MATIFERLKRLIAEQLDTEEKELTPETSFADDLNVDSLDLIELITAMEEKFSTLERKLEIADEDAEKIHTIQDAVVYLRDQEIEDA
ncbi:MAG: acyl carrier protein [Dehalococcoidia bacterium]|nr:acyl carrier protein [Dehalococcoidia bacterium]